MLSESLQDALNEQIKNEFYSAYLYLAMSSYCESQNLPGMANWLRVQYLEELGHGLRFYDYVNDRGGRVILGAIDQPPVDFGSPLQLFEEVAAHEAKVTAMINNLYAMATKENDYTTQAALQWFITEQVEEEKNADQIVKQIRMVQGNPAGLFMIDQQLAARVLAPGAGPVPVPGAAPA